MFSSNSSSVQPRPRRRRRCGHEEKDNGTIYNQRKCSFKWKRFSIYPSRAQSQCYRCTNIPEWSHWLKSICSLTSNRLAWTLKSSYTDELTVSIVQQEANVHSFLVFCYQVLVLLGFVLLRPLRLLSTNEIVYGYRNICVISRHWLTSSTPPFLLDQHTE